MLADIILRYGYALVFVSAAVEGDATLLTATFLAHRGYLQLDLVIVVAAAATVAINQVARFNRSWIASIAMARCSSSSRGSCTAFASQSPPRAARPECHQSGLRSATWRARSSGPLSSGWQASRSDSFSIGCSTTFADMNGGLRSRCSAEC
jgi:hypothetical protein